MTEYQAYLIKRAEARLYDKLMDAAVIARQTGNAAEYNETRPNWLTAHFFVQYYAGLFPEIMKAVQL